MQKAASHIAIIMILLSYASCKKTMKAGDYVSYVRNEEHGLVKTIAIDGFEFSMQYRPYDYIVLMESKGDLSGYDARKRKTDLEGTAWFSVAIKRADEKISPLRYGLSSLDEYNTRLNYYLNEAKKDFWLVYGTDTIRPMSYLFENNYNLTPQETIMLGFLLPKGEPYPKKKMQLSYNDHVLGSGIVKATYSESTLKNIPNLIYKTE